MHHEGLKPTLVEMAAAGTAPVGVPALGMGQGEQAHEGGEVIVAPRPEDQVPMIGHEAIGEDTHRHALLHRGQHAFKGAVVLLLFEDGLASVSAVEHMINQTAGGVAVGASHGPLRLPDRWRCVNKWFLTPLLSTFIIKSR